MENSGVKSRLEQNKCQTSSLLHQGEIPGQLQIIGCDERWNINKLEKHHSGVIWRIIRSREKLERKLIEQ